MEIMASMKMIAVSKDDFYNKIKNVIITDNLEIQLVINDVVVAAFIIRCNDCIIELTVQEKDVPLVRGTFKRETGESIPIDDIINWYESRLNNI